MLFQTTTVSPHWPFRRCVNIDSSPLPSPQEIPLKTNKNTHTHTHRKPIKPQCPKKKTKSPFQNNTSAQNQCTPKNGRNQRNNIPNTTPKRASSRFSVLVHRNRLTCEGGGICRGLQATAGSVGSAERKTPTRHGPRPRCLRCVCFFWGGQLSENEHQVIPGETYVGVSLLPARVKMEVNSVLVVVVVALRRI